MSEHRTDPHGWVVKTDTYYAPCTAGYDVRVHFGERYPGPSIGVCIADGPEAEQTHMSADEARHYAAMLNEAADILDAFNDGRYTPPKSTYQPREPTPLQAAMMGSYLSGWAKMLNRPSVFMGDAEGDPEGSP